MSQIEVITRAERAVVPVVRNPANLAVALSKVVGSGSPGQYNDAAFMRLQITSASDNPALPQPNLILRRNHLAFTMANGGNSSYFQRVSSLEAKQFVVAPAQVFPECEGALEIKLNLAKAISFGGQTLVRAMKNDGWEPETEYSWGEEPFQAYPNAAIGYYLLDNCGIDRTHEDRNCQ